MSAFVPENIAEDPVTSKKDLEEEHTRELQIEQAFKIFERALEQQKSCNYNEAYKEYESIFKLDVVSNHYFEEEGYIKGLQNGSSNTVVDELAYLSPNIKSLRYLVFRNRGFLYYNILKLGNDLTTFKLEGNFIERSKHFFYSMIDDFIICFVYQEVDEDILNVLYRIFNYLDLLRLEKFAIEYSLSSSQESDDLMGLLPIDKVLIRKMKLFQDALEGVKTKSLSDVDMSFLDAIRNDLSMQQTKAVTLSEVSIRLSSSKLDWFHVIEAINVAIKQNFDKEKFSDTSRSKIKDQDVYLFTESPIERIVFDVGGQTGKDAEVEEEDDEEDEEEEEEEEGDEDEEEAEEEPKEEVTAKQVNGNSIHEKPNGDSQEEDKSKDIIIGIDDSNKMADPNTFEKIEGNEGKDTKKDSHKDDPNNDSMDIDADSRASVAEGSIKDEEMNSDGVDEDDVFFELKEHFNFPSTSQNSSQKAARQSIQEHPTPSVSTELACQESDSKKRRVFMSSSSITYRSSKRLQKSEINTEYEEIKITEDTFYETAKYFETLNGIFKITSTAKLENIVPLFVNQKENINEISFVNDFISTLNTWRQSYTPNLNITKLPTLTSSNRTSNNNEGIAVGVENSSTSDEEKHTDIEKQRLIEVLSSFDQKAKSSLSDTCPKLSTLETANEVRQFLTSHSGNVHYVNLRYLIIHRLLTTSPSSTTSTSQSICYITEAEWSSKLFKIVRDMVLQIEYSLLSSWARKPDDINTELAIGVYEILVDSFMTIRTNLTNAYNQAKRKPLKSTKNIINSLHLELYKFQCKLDRWKSFLEENIPQNVDKIIWYRYKWALSFHEKVNAPSHDCSIITTMLEDLLKEITEKNDKEINIPMPNYINIMGFSVETLRARINTASILAVFSKILNFKGNNTNEAKLLLEMILIEEPLERLQSLSADLEESIKPIKVFLDGSNIDMKLSLWNILFLFYNDSKSLIQFQQGYEKLLQFLISFLNSEVYKNSETEQRITNLIKVTGCFGDYSLMLLDNLKENKWALSEESNIVSIDSTFRNLLKMFEVFYIFSLHEETAIISPSTKTSISSTSKKAYETFKDILVHTICLIYLYHQVLFDNKNGPSKKIPHELLAIIHDQLGLRRLCDSGKGVFLNMMQDILSSLQMNGETECEDDLIQIISCRYNYKLTIDKFTPIDHGTTQISELDLLSTVELSKLILPLCFKKNPINSPPKADMKMIIDAFFEVVGEPEIESNPTLNNTNQRLEYFFDSTIISPKFMRDSFHGLSKLELHPKAHFSDQITSIARDGLYYLEGLLMFTSYKIRKKSMQSRAVELENIIQLLKYDLIFGNNRIESWFLLGQAYGFLVEDDLIWTSDKLIFPERKTATANIQRKSLICYLMAINESIRFGGMEEKLQVKPVFGSIMSHFAKEMYSACMKPMDLHAFKVQLNPKFVKLDDLSNTSTGGNFLPVASRSIASIRLCYKIIQQSLHLAINDNSSDWTIFYLLSKIQSKLELPVEDIFKSLLISVELAIEQSNPTDPIVEPHYRLCSLVYKLTKADKIDLKQAMSYLLRDSVIVPPSKDIEDPIALKESFYKYIVLCLKKVMSYDKKKWHHRPRYRLSKILFDDFNNVLDAMEEMGNIVSLKATSKTLVLIWKPENERPGKHFYYTFEYALFYIVILSKQLNLTSLIQMLPKLRRSNSTMISLYTAWEGLCSNISRIIRELLDVTDNLTESFLQQTTYQNFILHSKEMIEYLNSKEPIPEEVEIHLSYLYGISDMKKYNNGYGPTSLIDDTIVAVYIRLYEIFSKKYNKIAEPDVTDSPSGRPKKLAKRDVFPFISDILKNNRREIEDILKAKPTIYNEFVETASKERKIREAEEERKMKEMKEAEEEERRNREAQEEERKIREVEEIERKIREVEEVKRRIREVEKLKRIEEEKIQKEKEISVAIDSENKRRGEEMEEMIAREKELLEIRKREWEEFEKKEQELKKIHETTTTSNAVTIGNLKTINDNSFPASSNSTLNWIMNKEMTKDETNDTKNGGEVAIGKSVIESNLNDKPTRNNDAIEIIEID